MKYLLPILLASTLFAADEPAHSVASGNKSTIFIEAKARSTDLVQAFELLKKDKSSFKINIRTTSGMIIVNVMELTASTSGTLLFLKLLSNQGLRYQILPTEEIAEISYSQ